MSAEERRDAVIDVALAEFAEGGLAATSTETIAAKAGISQPYLFRLFPTKLDLFIEAVKRCGEEIRQVFVGAAGDLTGHEALRAMGKAYDALIRDRSRLLLQLQMYAACADPDVCATARSTFRSLWETVKSIAGLPDEDIRQFFAYGMLCNVVTAMDLESSQEAWAQGLRIPHD